MSYLRSARLRLPIRTRWRIGLVLLLLETMVAPGGSSSRGEDSPGTLRPLSGGSSGSWRTPLFCGVNSMYVFLRLQGVQVSHQEMEADLPVSARGSTLRDMREVARRHGVAARVVRATPEQLWRCELPAIAHMEKDSTAGYDNQSRGHFVVVVGADRRVVRYIDGSSGIIQTKPAAEFLRQWSGLLLIRESALSRSVYLAGAVAAVVASLLAVGLLVRRRLGRQAATTVPAATESRVSGLAPGNGSGPGPR